MIYTPIGICWEKSSLEKQYPKHKESTGKTATPPAREEGFKRLEKKNTTSSRKARLTILSANLTNHIIIRALEAPGVSQPKPPESELVRNELRLV